MADIEGNIQINDPIENQKESIIIDESPNKDKIGASNLIQIDDSINKNENDKNKIETPKKENNGETNNNNDDTNYPISENVKKGLFSQFDTQNIEINENITDSRMTLDEPVLKSLQRDLLLIYNKLKHVITPRLTSRKIEELYNWDLWGPLIFCFLLCISLSNDNNESSTFVVIFVVFWIGGLIVTFNGQFLGANIGICQMICLLGYCSFPITVGGMIIGFLNITKGWMKCVIVFIAFLWSCLASVGFVSALVPREKELITIIPVILFFISLSLFVLNY